MSPGVVAAIHLAGVRGEPCGAVRWTVGVPLNIFMFLTLKLTF